MGDLQIGELAAVATALLWTLSALIWTFSGRHIGALAVSFLRLPITCVYVLAYVRIFRGQWLPSDADGRTWLILGVSGFFGFFLADACLFKALILIGPRLTLLVQALTAPLTSLIAWACLGDRLTGQQWLAMAITVAGVVWVVLERRGGNSPQDRRQLSQGLILALIAAVAQAVGFVLSKQGIGECDAVDATFIRVLGALVGYVVLISLTRRWPAMWAAVQKGRVMAVILFGAFVGPFLGVALCMEAVRRCPAGVATTIVGTTPVLILPFVILIYHEKVTLRAVGGALLSVIGVALLLI